MLKLLMKYWGDVKHYLTKDFPTQDYLTKDNLTPLRLANLQSTSSIMKHN